MDIDPNTLSADAKALLVALQAMQQQQQRRDAEQQDQRTRDNEALQREIMALSAAVKTGFPDGDLDGHRRYHELLIEEALERKRMRSAIFIHVAKSSTWALILGLLAVLWIGFKKKFGIGE
ncbi:hypothetical protein [Bordetella petrii]|uniref:hypothetical protein n=1 Tax=Bordetella petrii TaxID=94624 RepID=UPI00047DFB3D|nr:hypothetical protein [Bordetella petrii]